MILSISICFSWGSMKNYFILLRRRVLFEKFQLQDTKTGKNCRLFSNMNIESLKLSSLVIFYLSFQIRRWNTGNYYFWIRLIFFCERSWLRPNTNLSSFYCNNNGLTTDRSMPLSSLPITESSLSILPLLRLTDNIISPYQKCFPNRILQPPDRNLAAARLFFFWLAVPVLTGASLAGRKSILS